MNKNVQKMNGAVPKMNGAVPKSGAQTETVGNGRIYSLGEAAAIAERRIEFCHPWYVFNGFWARMGKILVRFRGPPPSFICARRQPGHGLNCRFDPIWHISCINEGLNLRPSRTEGQVERFCQCFSGYCLYIIRSLLNPIFNSMLVDISLQQLRARNSSQGRRP